MMEEIVFPNNIRMLRLAKGVSVEELSEKLPMSKSGISKVETGVRTMNEAQLIKCAAILGCAPSDIVINPDTTPEDQMRKWRADAAERLLNNVNSGRKPIGNAIKALRQKQKLTFADVEKASRLKTAVIFRIEAGERDLEDGEKEAIIKALKVTPKKFDEEVRRQTELLPQVTEDEMRGLTVRLPEVVEAISARLARQGYLEQFGRRQRRPDIAGLPPAPRAAEAVKEAVAVVPLYARIADEGGVIAFADDDISGQVEFPFRGMEPRRVVCVKAPRKWFLQEGGGRLNAFVDFGQSPAEDDCCALADGNNLFVGTLVSKGKEKGIRRPGKKLTKVAEGARMGRIVGFIFE